MKTPLAKLALRKAIGLYLGDHEIAVSKVAFTPLGPVEIASNREEGTPENAEEATKRLLAPLLGRKGRGLVAVGLPVSRVFFGSRQLRGGGEVTPESLLQKVFSSPNIRIDDLTVDLLKRQVNKLPVASVAACRKKYMAGVMAIFKQSRARLFCAEPEACALVRLAVQQGRFPRRAKTALCFFLNATHGLAVITVGGAPLAWRQFSLPAGSEGLAILSAARTLQTQQKHYELESVPGYALMCGRQDLQERLQREQLPSQLETRVLWHEGPELSGPAVALGLALGCQGAGAAGFDLSRKLKPPASLGEIFPWADLALTAALVGTMGGVLALQSASLGDALLQCAAKSSQHTCLAGAGVGHVEQDEKALEQKVTAVGKFLGSRILWTSYTNDIARRLPPNASLRFLQADNGLDLGSRRGGGRPKKLLLLKATAPYAGDNLIPHEIDDFLDALRRSKLLKRDLPSVELADIKRNEGLAGRSRPEATFTVVCSPGAGGNGGGKPVK